MDARAGRVPGIDFECAHWTQRRAMAIWGGFGGDEFWRVACRQASAEWALLAFVRRLTG
jgi:hypothetical protein